MGYSARSSETAGIWQDEVRSALFDLLMLDHLLHDRQNIPINPEEISSEDKGEFLLKEMEIQSTLDRRIRVLVTVPKHTAAPWPAVVCIHGHGGKLHSVYEKNSPYNGFASELAALNYVTVAGIVSQHEVYEKGMILMGERLWDLMRCVDYLESFPEVDRNRIGCAGLSLGGEMAMWLGAMDIRIRAEVSAGFLTKMDHMEQDHCMCWKFDGLRELVDFADIYSLMAPRPLQCQNGLKEPVSQFYVPIAREAFKEIEVIYRDFDRPENLMLHVHDDGHVVDIQALLCFLDKHLKNKK
jgi:esterase/lipase